MRRHPEFTFETLRRVDAFRDLAAHPERLDGSGYHRGLTGDQLSRPARDLAVADGREALSAERPYRDALSPDEFKAIMARDAGTALCPESYVAAEAVLDEGIGPVSVAAEPS